MKNSISFVYMITSPTSRIYVGSTSQALNSRWEDYKSLNCKMQIKLYNSFIKYGVENHIFEEIWSGDINEMLQKEAILGNFYNVLDNVKGLNLKLPKINDVYQCVSDETKNKIRRSHLGKKMPDSTRQAIRKANLGRKVEYKKKNLSIEQRLVLSNNAKKIGLGKNKVIISSKGREKLRLLAKNRIHTKEENLKVSDKNSISISQYDLNGNFIRNWKSAREVYNILNFSYKNIQSVCSGKRKTACDFIWKYNKINKL